MNKDHNKIENYKEIIQKLHEHDIPIMGCFVFGSDEDTPAIFKETVDFIIETGIDLPRFTCFTPFPGTAAFDRLEKEGRITTWDWDKYNAQNAVFKPKNMSAEELEAGVLYAWRESYKLKNIFKRLSKSRSQLRYLILANLGYMKYARDLSKYR